MSPTLRGPELRRDRNRLPGNAPQLAFWRARSSPESTSVEWARDPALARLEAALFCAAEPLSARRLAILTGLPDAKAVSAGICQLQQAYQSEGSAFQIADLAGGYQLLTRPEYFPWLVRLPVSFRSQREPLTATLLETIAIIAYRQPIMRAELESIRGVNCAEVLRELIQRGLARIVGRDESLGRPILYGTTKKFLQVFGLRSLDDLPPI